MRKYSVLTATISALLLALISTPANGNGVTTESCTTGTFTITSGVVSDGASCAGAAVIPDGVTSIGVDAFNNARSLISITIPASVTSIGVDAFRDAIALTDVTFDGTSTLTSIGGGAFIEAQSLTSFTIPTSVTSIGNWAFLKTIALTSITIPASVTTIGNNAFINTGLTSFTVANGNPNYSSLHGVLFNIGKTYLIQYPTRNLQTSYSIPASVTSIGASAFSYATSLTSITIPASVISIGASAFQGATKLASVNFSGDAPTAGTNAFYTVAAGATAYINNCATNFGTIGDVWNNLTVAIGVNDATCNDSAVATAPAPIVANAYRADRLATVYFSPLSSKLSKAAKKQLEAAVIANPSAVYKITGYVQKSIFAKNAKNDASLSLARAKAIETHLASLGAGVTFTVVTDAGLVPVKNGKSNKARRATLYVMTPVVQ